MKSLGLLLVAFAFAPSLGAVPSSAEAKAQRVVAFVAAEQEGRVVAVDVGARRVIASAVVARGPHNVSWGGNAVLVTSPAAGRVTVLDARTLRVRHVFTGFGSPHDVERRGRFAYVTDEARAQVVVLDLARLKIAARIRVASQPHNLVVFDRIVVTHRTSRLTVIDLAKRRVVGTIAAGGAAHDVDRAPDTARLYLTYWGVSAVGAVDAGTGRLLFRRAAGSAVHHLAFDFYAPRLLVTDNAGSRLLVLSAQSGRTERVVRGCRAPHHVAVATPIRTVAACNASGTLAIFGPRGLLASVRVGAGPHGVAVGRI